VLVAGVVIGQLGIKVSDELKTAFFLLFLFAIGYRTGPQFFSGLKTGAFPQIALTFLFCFSALGLAYALARIMAFDVGTAGGLMAGATSESAAVGTASDAIKRLGLDAATTQQFIGNVAVGFAVRTSSACCSPSRSSPASPRGSCGESRKSAPSSRRAWGRSPRPRPRPGIARSPFELSRGWR
jgi:uncharacterized transporter YbjL